MKRVTCKAPNFFPMMVRLQDRKCLVVGGGKVAQEKVAGLLAHGAKITVVSPNVTPAIERQVQAGVLLWKKRRFSSRDLAGAFLVIAATDSPAVNSATFEASKQRGVLCNAVDDPENCDFFYPAVVRRGPLQIAISTNGQSPALASRLRRELEKQFGTEWGEWVEHIGKARMALMREQISPQLRRAKLLALASEKSFGIFLRERKTKDKIAR